MRHALFAGLLTIAAAGSAQAAPIISFTNGAFGLTPQAGSIFQGFDTAPGNGAVYVSAGNETTVGDVRTYANTVQYYAVSPYGVDGDTYLAVADGSYSVLFDAPVEQFSFVLGSLDSYNSLTLRLTDGTSFTYNGQQIIGEDDAGAINTAISGRVFYDFSGGARLSSVTFASTTRAFEIDALASAVPEPTSWALMIGGLAFTGAQLRSGRRRSRFAAA